MDQQTPLPAPDPPSATPQPLIGWQATSIPVHERSKRWYIIGGTMLLLGIAYGIFSGAWSFSIVLLLCGAMYFLLRNHVPQTKTIVIAREGVLLDNDFTRYEDLTRFWIIDTPQYHELHIARRNKRNGEMIIQTGEIEPAAIRATLGQFLEEAKEKKESLIDIFIRICKL